MEEEKNIHDELFRINSLGECSWAFRKLKALNEKKKEITELAEDEVLRIEAWEKDRLKSIDGSISYFEGLLIEYYKRTGQKVSTPYGKLGARKTKKWTYTNEKELIEYLKQDYSRLIRVKEEINKEELKKLFKDGVNEETGEVLPGVEITEEENINIKVEG